MRRWAHLGGHLALGPTEQSNRAQKSHLWNIEPFPGIRKKSIAYIDGTHKNNLIVSLCSDGKLPLSF